MSRARVALIFRSVAWRRVWGRLAGMLGLILLTGCSINYYDKQTGTAHLWGFGHLKMRAVPAYAPEKQSTNGTMAVATGVRTLGVNVGGGEDYAGLGLGWDSRSRLVIKTEDSQFYLIWPTNTVWMPALMKDHLFTLQVGTDFPLTNGWPATPAPPNSEKP